MLLYYNLYYNVLYCVSLHYTAWYQERIMSKKLKALLMVPIYNYVYSLPVLVITGIKDFPL